MLFSVMLIFMVVVGIVIFGIVLFVVNRNMEVEKHNLNLGENLVHRIDEMFYKVASKKNFYVEYDIIQEDDVNDFIHYWYS